MTQSILETLQREFCPPLDSSLLAALVNDVAPQGNDSEPSEDQIDGLRAILQQLAAQAEAEQFVDLQLSLSNDDSSSTPSFSFGGESSAMTSCATSEPDPLFSTPLGFLHTAMPDIPMENLRTALLDAERGLEGELDMWGVIEALLSQEAALYSGLEDEDEAAEQGWDTVTRKKASKKKWGPKVSLVDIRQQRSHPTRASTIDTRSPISDTWTQITSISTHVATLLPSEEPTFFQSYFHSPKYQTPYIALRTALVSIANRDPRQDHAATLVELLDILLPSFELSDAEQRSQLIADTELCLNATAGKGEETLELVGLLQDLQADLSSGELEMGVYHNSPAKLPTAEVFSSKLPSGPPPIPPPLRSKHSREASPSPSRHKPSPFQWQKVPYRKKFDDSPNPLAAHIPTYSRDVNGMKVRGTGNAMGKGGKGDVGELQELRRHMGESVRKRNEMLREAARMWQKGNTRSRGGEVAMYFAEKAREYQELAKKDALDVARLVVESKRMRSADPDTVDLHGTTAAEAVQIVKELLEKRGAAQIAGKPLKIITGRGAHSANQTSVLKPAVKRALLDDGWTVSTWDAGLIVRAKRRGTAPS
ncbi:hypothetical protein C8J56DRAFT_839162 [Mycena floridula]|nr:hypothetical protein C8J56DRAFT_839162 [Mycena floridula]